MREDTSQQRSDVSAEKGLRVVMSEAVGVFGTGRPGERETNRTLVGANLAVDQLRCAVQPGMETARATARGR